MKILSLFDGMACGLVALKRIGVKVDRYVAYENNKHAIYVANKNHPEIEHKGSVVGADFTQYSDFDLIIAGSPCQGFSIAGYQLGFDDPRSKLYFEFLRAKKESGIKDFLLENVQLNFEFERIITNHLKRNLVHINSKLLSAQLRARNYWASFPISQPWDKGINLQDILQKNNGWNNLKKYKVNKTPSRDIMWLGGKCPNITNKSKSNCLTTKQDRWANAGLIEFEDYCRYLTHIECERLQTLPDNYTSGVPDTARYEMLGNGWTVDVIAHIFSCWLKHRAA